MLTVIPALDVLDGGVVRLLRGSFDETTRFAGRVEDWASRYRDQGARRIHVVDLEGARSGDVDVALCQAVASLGLEVQLGGGIRTIATAGRVLATGVGRVVIGSMAVSQPALLSRLVAELGGDRVVVAVDVRHGAARGSGWLDEGRDYQAVVGDSVQAGVGSLLVTGIETDGTMGGPDVELLSSVRTQAPDVEIIASGGVGRLEDLTAVAAAGADAVVIGRALLEGAFSFEDAQSIAGR